MMLRVLRFSHRLASHRVVAEAEEADTIAQLAEVSLGAVAAYVAIHTIA